MHTPVIYLSISWYYNIQNLQKVLSKFHSIIMYENVQDFLEMLYISCKTWLFKRNIWRVELKIYVFDSDEQHPST